MGQTQLLLIILGVLLIGVAVYVGITMFTANAEEATRNAIIHDLQNFSVGAHAYYSKLVAQGGGNQSFSNITMGQIYPMAENANARYFIESATQTECLIVGVGKVVASNGDSLRIRLRVTPQRNIIEILN